MASYMSISPWPPSGAVEHDMLIPSIRVSPVHRYFCDGVHTPFSRAAAAVTSLKTEPGGYAAWRLLLIRQSLSADMFSEI